MPSKIGFSQFSPANGNLCQQNGKLPRQNDFSLLFSFTAYQASFASKTDSIVFILSHRK